MAAALTPCPSARADRPDKTISFLAVVFGLLVAIGLLGGRTTLLRLSTCCRQPALTRGPALGACQRSFARVELVCIARTVGSTAA